MTEIGTPPELDLARLRALRAHLGEPLPAVVSTLVAELEAALERIDRALRAGDPAEAALGAHAARNSALMIDARPLLRGLDAAERAALAGDLGRLRTARDGLRACWPQLRDALTRAAAPD